MTRHAPEITCSESDWKELKRISKSRTEPKQLIERARIILECLQGKENQVIAQSLKTRPNTISKWRKRFAKDGMKGLQDSERPGAPRQYGVEFRNKVLKVLEEAPPKGQSTWDGVSVAARLGSSADAVWKVLRKEGICLQRHRSWCVSTDKEFVAKAADVIGLYLNPPENAIVLSVDEKPSMQALERATGYVETSSGKIVRGLKSTYKRHGTLNLFAALNVATGEIKGSTTQQKKRPQFQEFMNSVVSEHPKDKEIHVILDNYSTHKKNDEWLEKHPNVHFHFTPTSASWLNQVEIWFGIFSRKALRGASFNNTDELKKAVEDFIEVYNQKAKPFVWKKREVKGSQLKNTIANLRN